MTSSFHIDSLVSSLTEAWKMSKLPKRDLAEKAGLHENTLRLFGTPSWQPRLDTIRKLEAILLQHPEGHSSV